jgi:hypothetical protein
MKRSLISRRQHGEILAAARRRHEAELANLQADIERLRTERDQFAKDRNAHRAAADTARTLLAKYETGLTTALVPDDPASIRKAITAWENAVTAHTDWKPDADSLPLIEGGAPRPTHPALLLRLALDRCRALENRLATAEGRPTGVVL